LSGLAPNSAPSFDRAAPVDHEGSRWASILRLAPVALLVVLVVMMACLLWRIDTDERVQHREELIRDALWVEQTLQFQMESQQGRLARLAADMASVTFDPQTFGIQATQLSLINPEIVRLLWLDGQFGVVAAYPLRSSPDVPVIEPPVDILKIAAQLSNKGTFTAPFVGGNGEGALAFVARIERPDRPGTLVALFSVQAILNQHVPWWIAERRAIVITDAGGAAIAKRSQVSPEASASSHSVAMGAPLRETTLTLASFREHQSLSQNGLVVTIVVLGLLAAAGFVARQRQIKRRRLAEVALDEEHAFRRAMESALLVGIRARDLDGRLLYANQAFCRMVGYTFEELVGQGPPMPYWMPDQVEMTRRVHDAVLAGQTIGQGLELTFRHRDGTSFDVLIYEAPLVDGQGRQRGWMGSVLDISDRKRVEEFARAQSERMQHTARLVTMGEIASLLAHDLNQPLATISSYQTGLQNRLAAADLTREDIEIALTAIGNSAERAGRIIRRVQHFVKKSEARMEALDVRDIVAEALALLDSEARKIMVRPQTFFPDHLPLVRADRVLVQQVLVNLICNGFEAMVLTPVDDRQLLVQAIVVDARHVEICVSDAGAGVPSAIVDQLFTPFVSTKPTGMGMGLSICRSIIELHGGHIRYEPNPLGGARLSFTLAIVDCDAHA
jgi:two-component system, LuxR family, sensor histidine kinase DctS